MTRIAIKDDWDRSRVEKLLYLIGIENHSFVIDETQAIEVEIILREQDNESK